MFKSWHNFKIKRLTGEVLDLYENGVMVLGFYSPLPAPENYSEDLEAMDGELDLGARLPGRTAKGSFAMEARDAIAHSLQTDKIFKIFHSREPFYIIRDAQPGKQLLVRRAGALDIPQEPGFSGEFDLEFRSASPYWESVADTTEKVDFNSSLWAVGMGLETNKEYKYAHTTASFAIENPGDVALDPASFGRPLQYVFKGASTNLKIENKTTGEAWSYTGTTGGGDTITLDGVRSFKGIASIFKHTNRGAVSLMPGRNDIVITGATGNFTFQAISKFYYV